MLLLNIQQFDEILPQNIFISAIIQMSGGYELGGKDGIKLVVNCPPIFGNVRDTYTTLENCPGYKYVFTFCPPNNYLIASYTLKCIFGMYG